MFGLDTTATTIEEPMFRVGKDDNLYFLERNETYYGNMLLTINSGKNLRFEIDNYAKYCDYCKDIIFKGNENEKFENYFETLFQLKDSLSNIIKNYYCTNKSNKTIKHLFLNTMNATLNEEYVYVDEDVITPSKPVEKIKLIFKDKLKDIDIESPTFDKFIELTYDEVSSYDLHDIFAAYLESVDSLNDSELRNNFNIFQEEIVGNVYVSSEGNEVYLFRDVKMEQNGDITFIYDNLSVPFHSFSYLENCFSTVNTNFNQTVKLFSESFVKIPYQLYNITRNKMKQEINKITEEIDYVLGSYK